MSEAGTSPAQVRYPEAPTSFQGFWQLGFGPRLVPIVPHDAEISERSSLYKRVGTKQDGRGKTPGVRGRDGKFFGFDWIAHKTEFEDLARWQSSGAGIGIKTGNGLIAIDADTLNLEHARIIREIVERHVGCVPARIGREPKCLYLVRVTDPLPYTRVEFGERDDKGRLKDRVELLSDGRQFVAHGIHPATGKPYTWPRGLLPFDKLPIVTPDALKAMMEELRRALPAATPIITEGSSARADVNQDALRGDPEKVRRAVSCIPNTSEHFPSREDYVKMGYAVKAALPDTEADAFDIWANWCERWDGGENEDAVMRADWDRMRPPFSVGANWLYELAERHTPHDFSRAAVWFDPITETEVSAFDFAGERDRKSDTDERKPLVWIDPTRWEGQALPRREWEVEGLIPKGEVTLLYGDGGVGKSLLAHQYATCAATGRDWLGQKTRAARVMCFFCEDSEEELQRRQHDINAALGVTFSELTGLRLISRKHEDNLFTVWNRHTGAMHRQAVWEQLRDDAKTFDADTVIVDTIADTYCGSEIDRVQVNAFVKSCLGRLAQEIGGSVIALGHPSQAGRSSGQGTSGSTAWSNAARSRLYLRYPAGADRGNIRELEGMKLNYGPKGMLLKLRWARGAFEMLAGYRPAGTPVSSSGMKSVGDAAEDAVVSALVSHSSERLNRTQRSPYFAPKVLKRLAPDILAAFSQNEVEAALDRLERRKAIRVERTGRDASYRPTFGYVVVPDNLRVAPTNDDGVFE